MYADEFFFYTVAHNEATQFLKSYIFEFLCLLEFRKSPSGTFSYQIPMHAMGIVSSDLQPHAAMGFLQGVYREETR